jgi:hypothetical protein
MKSPRNRRDSNRAKINKKSYSSRQLTHPQARQLNSNKKHLSSQVRKVPSKARSIKLYWVRKTKRKLLKKMMGSLNYGSMTRRLCVR